MLACSADSQNKNWVFFYVVLALALTVGCAIMVIFGFVYGDFSLLTLDPMVSKAKHSRTSPRYSTIFQTCKGEQVSCVFSARFICTLFSSSFLSQ